jgi:AcrR family transcriptional regulator
MLYVHFMQALPSPPPSPRELATRARILAAAQHRFEAFGYRRTGMAEIAREAGVAAGTLYRYFENKEQLFEAVLDALNERWLARAREAVAEPGSGLERIARLGTASVEIYRERSLLNAVLQRDAEMVFKPMVEEQRRRVLGQTVRLMADVIRDGIADGTIRAVDPEKTARILFLAGNALFLEATSDYGELLPLYADIVQQGLLPR